MAKAAPKRLRDELNKIIKTKTFGEAINDLYISGLLAYIIPGLPEILDDPTPLEATTEPSSLWQHTRHAIYTLIKEHPFTDTLSKLTVLMADVAMRHGTARVGELLLAAQIGKEKVGSITHTLQLYRRYCGFFDEQGNYIARPRELPHFMVAIAKSQAEFRRIVRALNVDRLPEAQAPIAPLYKDSEWAKETAMPAQKTKGKSKNKHKSEAKGDGVATSRSKMSASQRRRMQRKRAAARRREQRNQEQQKKNTDQ